MLNLSSNNSSLRFTHTIYLVTSVLIFVSLLQSSHCKDSLQIKQTDSSYIGGPKNLTCIGHNDTASIWWSKEDKNLTSVSSTVKGAPVETLIFKNITLNDFGVYTCYSQLSAGEVLNSSHGLFFNVMQKLKLPIEEVVDAGEKITLVCEIIGYPVRPHVEWKLEGVFPQALANSSEYIIQSHKTSLTQFTSTLTIVNASKHHNGDFSCDASHYDLKEEVKLVVRSSPNISLDLVRAVGKTLIYLNWTIDDGNVPLKELKLWYKDNDGKEIMLPISTDVTEVLIKNLSPNTVYSSFHIEAINELGHGSDELNVDVRTLKNDPEFVPTVLLNGLTSNTVTLRWDNLHTNVSDYYNYYNVSVETIRNRERHFYIASETPFMVNDLKPGTDYLFEVRACSTFTKQCDQPSNAINGTTLDGMPSAPRNIRVECHFDPKTHASLIEATWDEPESSNGRIIEYVATLRGNASFLDERGRPAEEQLGPIRKSIRVGQPRKVEFDNQPPNTNIYISVCAKTRTRMCGNTEVGHCTTPTSLPNTESLSKADWKAVQKSESQRIFFLITLPRISQRNGSICCIRIVVVRLSNGKTVKDLEPPQEMDISSYEFVHNNTVGGAYIADVVEPSRQNTMIGDDVVHVDEKAQPCHKCWSAHAKTFDGSYRPSEQYPSRIGRSHHRKRHTSSSNLVLSKPRDGPLDADSTYTAYLDAVVLSGKHEQMRAQSRYFNPLRPVRVSEPIDVVPGMAIVGSLILALVVVLIALMCVMRLRRKEPGDQEMGFSNSIQQWCRRLRGQQPVPTDEPPNLPSILKDQLVDAYLERMKENGFLMEFEKLPDRFCDRTSHASDLRENSGKNRYPDIKAYDQTRVKLSTVDGSSDYINANYVVGYKERKKFICAQGPMEATINDWWRMIWEQHVHLILMLTNIEEYNKTKCAKYWPCEGSTNFADLTITHCSEKRYSDYLVRTLKMTKNKSGSSEDGTKEEREVTQYHYLVWKDFMAPEYPVGILRFIKRFNEAYAPDKGPILVHCSAGVGRTGTLVALDSLSQQLNEEGCVSIFNTICDLRHQRNYLVQSIKQYIFIYRALMEQGQFGDTEVPVSDLKATVEKFKSVPEGKETSPMQDEYDRLVQVIEDRKPISIGALEENRQRNRHENVVPYDRSRVILTPMPGFSKDMSNYINASFIEGYDNTDQFIIAQDPLENTVGDFWRMIVQQNVRSIVMLSETGEEKCPRYWPEKDQETTHEYIKVKYMQSQSFPFYYRREFSVTDTISDHSYLVTQFQYNGWPMGEGEVPQVDRGIVELIDTTSKYKDTLESNVGPMVVHCSDGADRSCIFVAIAILTQQMMNESRVDVFSVVRKLRSQRQGMFRNFAQFEFIYRGLVTYAELHVANGNASH